MILILSMVTTELWSYSPSGEYSGTAGTLAGSQAGVQTLNKLENISDAHVHKGVFRIKLTEEAVKSVEKKMGRSAVLQTRAVGKTLNVGVTTLNSSFEATKTTQMKRVFPYHPKYEARQQAEGLHLWYEIAVDEDMTTSELMEVLKADPSVKLAEPVLKKVQMDVKGSKQQILNRSTTQNQIINALTRLPLSASGSVGTKTSAVPFAASARNWQDNPPVNDPYLLLQWHYYNYGQISGANLPDSDPSASINLFDAWEITMGDPKVIVSVHDHGVDYTHPDIASNMWVNEAELYGSPGIDDDGNGYVDDIYGFNFVTNGSISPGIHGTHVAGTIAAVNNNNLGVAGIAGGKYPQQGVRIMSCQILDNVESTTEGGAAPSYVYAANNGAVISQNSWGYSAANYYEQADIDAMNYFIKYAGLDENGKPLKGTPMVGGIIIFSAGNDSSSEPKWPGYYEKVLSVAATGPWNEQTNYTNYGEWVDISAPGGNLTAGADAGVLSLSLYNNGQDYGYQQGTSMSCPHVSGVAALVLSKYGHESYTPEMLRHRLLTTAVPWSELNQPDHEGRMGVGLLSASRALQQDQIVAPDSIKDLRVNLAGYDFITINFTAPKDEDNGSAHAYEIRYSKEEITEKNVLDAEVAFQLAQKAGTKEEVTIDYLEGNTQYYIAVRSTDLYGNRSKLSNRIVVSTTEAPSMSVTPDSLELTIADAQTQSTAEAKITITNGDGGSLRYTMRGALTYTPQIKDGAFPQEYSNIANHKQIDFSGKIGEDGSDRFIAATRFNVKDKPFILTHISAAVVSEGIAKNATGYLKDTIELQIYLGGNTPTDGRLVCRSGVVIPNISYLLAYEDDLYFSVPDVYQFEPGEHFWIVFDFKKGFYQPMRFNTGTSSPSGYELYSNDAKKWIDLNTLNIDGLDKNYAYRIFALSDMPDVPEGVITFDPVTGTIARGASEDVKLKIDAKELVEGKYRGYATVLSNDPLLPEKKVPVKFTVGGHRVGIRSLSTLSVGSVVQGYSASRELVVYNDSLGTLNIDTVYSTLPQFTVELKDAKKKSNGKTSAKIVQGDSVVYTVTFKAPMPSTNPVENADSIGSFISKLIFETNASTVTDGKYSVVVDGLSIDRPIAELDKTDESITLRKGETQTVSFNLKNAGKYRLDYTISKDMIAEYDYSDLRPNVDEYFGTRRIESYFPYVSGNTDISNEVKGNRAYVVPIPFEFTSYGQTYDTITIYGDGMICLGNRPTRKSKSNYLGGTYYAEPATIYPVYNGGDITTARGGTVLLKVEADKATIEYSAAGTLNSNGLASDRVRVRTIIYSNGNVEFYHQYLEPDGKETIQDGVKEVTKDLELVTISRPYPFSSMIGISDLDGKAGIGLHSLREDNFTGKHALVAPLNGYWEGSYYTGDGTYEILESTFYDAYVEKGAEYARPVVATLVQQNKVFSKDVTPSQGSLLPGEAVDVYITMRMDEEIEEDTYSRTFVIVTNDPLNDTIPFIVDVEWQSEAKPELLQTELNYGNIGKDVTVTNGVTLKNTGGKAFTVKAYMESGTHFALQPATAYGNSADPRTCKGLGSLNFNVDFTPTEEIDYSDRLIIEFTDPVMPLMSVPVRGRGAKRPILEISPAEGMWGAPAIKDTLMLKDHSYTDTSVILKNTGDADLIYNLATTDWIKRTGAQMMASGMDKTGYFWEDNSEANPALSYEWIWENPTEFSPLGRDELGTYRYSKEIELPWSFPYYGENYEKCYVNMSGMIYFDRSDITYSMVLNTILGDNVMIPQADDKVNGFIAPLSGSFDQPKIYYEEIGEEGDKKMVFTFSMRDLLATQDTTRAVYQAILFEDGRIKFQYKDVEKAIWRGNKTIGMENRTGDDGLRIAYRNADYIKNKRAIMITPTEVETLKAGESRKVNLRIDPEGLLDGTYNGQVYVRSNDPKNPTQTRTVQLRAYGVPEYKILIDGKEADTLHFGQVIRARYPKEHEQRVGTGEYIYSWIPVSHKRTVIIQNTGNVKLDMEEKGADRNMNITEGFKNNMLTGISSATIEAKDELRVVFNLNTDNAEAEGVPAGHYSTKYAIKNVCKVSQEVCEDIYGYTLKDSTKNFLGRWSYYWYSVDSLTMDYDLYDLPYEEMIPDQQLHDVTADNADQSYEFNITINNGKLDSTYWRDMHKNPDHFAVSRQAPLDYQLRIENLTESEYLELLEGDGEKAVSAIAKAAAYPNAAKAADFLPHAYQSASASAVLMADTDTVTYVDSLGYFNFDSYGSGYSPNGKGSKFINYTRYQSGAEGFNLTHLEAMMARLTLHKEEGYDIEVKVLIGADLLSADEIYTQIHTHSNTKEEDFRIETIKFDEPVYIYPNQYFWVAIVNKNNTMVVSTLFDETLYTDAMMENFVVDNETYFEYIAGVLQQPVGWAMFCRSSEELENPSQWISLTKTEGILNAGETDHVKVLVNPKEDLNHLPNRYAKISITSNDPYPYGIDTTMRSGIDFINKNPALENVNLTDFVKDRGYMLVRLRVNQGPEFTDNTSKYMVLNENVDSIVMIRLYD
ncbi:S8 family serine peptidase, partial [Odoribacter sp. OttesenSCG-928-A06]|nr:S8 family serine peptidase [Odoribacter sp. OttesenSCG-928-A06]